MSEFVTIAILSRVRGNRGELTAVALSSKPERYEHLKEVHLSVAGTDATLEVESTWWHDRALIFKFRGVDSITDAERWRGAEVRVPVEERVALDPGEYFYSDLVGCEVRDRRTGERIGCVADFQEAGGSGLLELEDGLLIPFAKAICPVIDVVARRIEVELPEGLREPGAP